jgi:hypothetical protein
MESNMPNPKPTEARYEDLLFTPREAAASIAINALNGALRRGEFANERKVYREATEKQIKKLIERLVEQYKIDL